MLRRWLKPAAFPLLLAVLNLYIAKDLFFLEYSQFMGSIEAAYISISRYMIENWRDLSWFPLWYGGIPFQNSYPPFLHAMVALTAATFRISPAHAHHIVTAIFYCLGPIALYALALRLTGSRWYSFWAGWIYSIFSPSIFLMPSVHADMGAWFGLRRYQALVFYGEGPHITGMALLPVALLCLDVALSKRTPLWYVLTAASVAAVALSNWLAAFTLVIALFAYLVAHSGAATSWKTWTTALGPCALAYALACSWIPPSTILDVRYNAQFVGAYEHVYKSIGLFSGLALLASLLLKYVMNRLRFSGHLQFAILFAVMIGAIPLAATWFKLTIVPQPERYHLEMDLAICLAAAFAFKAIADKMPPGLKVPLAVTLVALSLFPARLDRRFARRISKPIDIAETIEYQTAKWFETHVQRGRVLAPGTISFWLNAFTDTPQLDGGFDQGIVNRTHNLVTYQILSADGAGQRAAEIANLWLRAYGVEAIAVGGPNSREVFKPFRHPDVFATAFSEAMHAGDDAVYWVPGRDASLAHVTAHPNLVRHQPANGLDIAETQVYVQSLNTPANFRWTSRHSAEIQATLRPEQVVSVQITYHPGWHATANGKSCRLFGDGLGQMVIEPQCDGACQLELAYDGGLEMRVAKVVSGASWLGCVGWILLSRRKRK
ncbi:MAG TPA: hypothetical protein VGP62_09075 [Bryobacteraceae bacterium]|nr:hypothetical protein [Bryobacteraceae bacterium]